jgi:hypothetical protein
MSLLQRVDRERERHIIDEIPMWVCIATKTFLYRYIYICIYTHFVVG